MVKLKLFRFSGANYNTTAVVTNCTLLHPKKVSLKKEKYIFGGWEEEEVLFARTNLSVGSSFFFLFIGKRGLSPFWPSTTSYAGKNIKQLFVVPRYVRSVASSKGEDRINLT